MKTKLNAGFFYTSTGSMDFTGSVLVAVYHYGPRQASVYRRYKGKTPVDADYLAVEGQEALQLFDHEPQRIEVMAWMMHENEGVKLVG